MREHAAYSSPSRRRLQCSTVIIVGSSEGTATAWRPDAPGVVLGADITAAAVVAAAVVAAAPVCGGAFAASFAASFGPACGVKRAGTGTGAGAAPGAPACRSSLHAFGLCMRRATPSRGFGVTSARHDERAPKTPW